MRTCRSGRKGKRKRKRPAPTVGGGVRGISNGKRRAPPPPLRSSAAASKAVEETKKEEETEIETMQMQVCADEARDEQDDTSSSFVLSVAPVEFGQPWNKGAQLHRCAPRVAAHRAVRKVQGPLFYVGTEKPYISRKKALGIGAATAKEQWRVLKRMQEAEEEERKGPGGAGYSFDNSSFDPTPLGSAHGVEKGVVRIFCDLVGPEQLHPPARLKLALRCVRAVRRGDSPLSRLLCLDAIICGASGRHPGPHGSRSATPGAEQGAFVSVLAAASNNTLLTTLFEDVLRSLRAASRSASSSSSSLAAAAAAAATAVGAGDEGKEMKGGREDQGQGEGEREEEDGSPEGLRFRLGLLSRVLCSCDALQLTAEMVERLWQHVLECRAAAAARKRGSHAQKAEMLVLQVRSVP